MIQRYEFRVRGPSVGMELDADGDYVRYDDHLAALTVTDAMVRRAWKVLEARGCVATIASGDVVIGAEDVAVLDGADKNDLRAALEAALAPERT